MNFSMYNYFNRFIKNQQILNQKGKNKKVFIFNIKINFIDFTNDYFKVNIYKKTYLLELD